MLPIQRYIGGYVAIYFGFIFLLSSVSFHDFLKKIFGLIIATIPFICVIAWNFIISDGISGSRSPAEFSFYQNLIFSLQVINDFFLPQWVLWFLLTLSCIPLSAYFFPHKSLQYKMCFIFIFLLPLVQLLAQTHSSSVYKIDPINPRFFIILTPLFYLLILILKYHFFKQLNNVYLVFLICVFSLLNFMMSNINNYNIFNFTNIDSNKAKVFLNNISPTHIGLYIKGEKHLAADLILTNKILPQDLCQDYSIYGDFIQKGTLQYKPNCNNKNGHIYHMITDEVTMNLPVILISKKGLPSNWKSAFAIQNTYQIQDINSFYALVKREQ